MACLSQHIIFSKKNIVLRAWRTITQYCAVAEKIRWQIHATI